MSDYDGETKSSCIYGPVPSWRLGRSLGIDCIPPKTCNWNCVYCQLGRTRPVVCRRHDYVRTTVVSAALRRFFERHTREDVDWVTFVGSGEPLLNSGIGRMIRDARELTELPVAVITNGSLLYRREVREEVSAAQAVLPSVDAGTPELYRRLNRPHPEVTFVRHVTGLTEFRQEYSGQLWVEVMLVRQLNDTPQALADIAGVLQRVEPDEIHLNIPSRSPAEPWVEGPDPTRVMQIAATFEDIAPVRTAQATHCSFDLSGAESVLDGIIDIITRHPMTQAELEETLRRWAPGQVDDLLEQLARSGRAQVVERSGRQFWHRSSSYFSVASGNPQRPGS
jgi:wyosine [tRNA(Phe)-imidazoG37] synthetase (radical SAM superfamily)